MKREPHGLKSQSHFIAKRSFTALFVIGMGFLLVGIFVEPNLHHCQLDVVLTPIELADEAKKAATLSLLKKANGNGWLLWVVAGSLVSVLSAIGLRSIRQLPD